jgi:hypothetical protein
MAFIPTSSPISRSKNVVAGSVSAAAGHLRSDDDLAGGLRRVAAVDLGLFGDHLALLAPVLGHEVAVQALSGVVVLAAAGQVECSLVPLRVRPRRRRGSPLPVLRVAPGLLQRLVPGDLADTAGTLGAMLERLAGHLRQAHDDEDAGLGELVLLGHLAYRAHGQ